MLHILYVLLTTGGSVFSNFRHFISEYSKIFCSFVTTHLCSSNTVIGHYEICKPKKYCRHYFYFSDLSQKAFKTLRYHKKAIRSVDFHHRYPLFCSGSDDGSIIVSHGRVYNDLSSEPLIVPVKVLKGVKTSKEYGVMSVAFHPQHPWLFGAGVDGTIRLYS